MRRNGGVCAKLRWFDLRLRGILKVSVEGVFWVFFVRVFVAVGGGDGGGVWTSRVCSFFDVVRSVLLLLLLLLLFLPCLFAVMMDEPTMADDDRTTDRSTINRMPTLTTINRGLTKKQRPTHPSTSPQSASSARCGKRSAAILAAPRAEQSTKNAAGMAWHGMGADGGLRVFFSRHGTTRHDTTRKKKQQQQRP